jgi:hypothetical protein
MKMPLVIIVILIPFQPGMGQPFPENDHPQADDEAEQGPETVDPVTEKMDLVLLHEKVKNRDDDEEDEEEPLDRHTSLMQIFEEPGHYPPPTSLVMLRKKSG